MSVAELPTEVVKPKRVRKPKAAAPVVEAPPAEEPAPAPTPARVRKPRAAKPKPEVKVEPKPEEGELTPTVSRGDPLALLAKLPPAKVGDLSKDQRHRRYTTLKRAVTLSLGSFVIVGAALAEIQEQEYWKLDRYANWDEFVQTEWDLGSKQRASQLITASRTFSDLKHYLESKGINVPLPSVESHIRKLQDLHTVEEQANAWQAALATAERKAGDRLRLTADHIEKVVQEHLGFKQLPDTGPNTNNPTPPEQPPERDKIPPTEEKPEDVTPPEDAAPTGEAPDQLEGFVPALEEMELVKTGGKVNTMTPALAFKYIIKGLKGGYFSHTDPLVKALVEVVNDGLVTWLENPDDRDVVEVDYDEGQVPEITVEYPEDGQGEDELDLADGPAE